jgi:putative CocE/NonD family hydrolase
MKRTAPQTRRFAIFSLLLLLVLSIIQPVLAQGGFSIREHYTKMELRIPMRDGVKLFTNVYVPKDTGQPYPIMLIRTPYSVAPYGQDAYRDTLGPSPKFGEEGFIFAYQDVRGKLLSEGEFVNMRPQKPTGASSQEIDESTDTYDTIDWLIKNLPNNNGKVGIWGISYPGFYAAAGVINSHPALKAASPQAPIADWFVGDDFHHNGALFLIDAFSFLSGFGPARPAPSIQGPPGVSFNTANDAYRFYLDLGPLPNVNENYFNHRIAFWDDMMEHGTYDAFWKARNLAPNLKGVKAAVMTVGGWFDAEDLHGALKVYKAIEKQNPGIQNRLVMGPWPHGGWSRGTGDKFGDISFNSSASAFYRESVELPFFNYYLKGKGTPDQPEAFVFATGANKWMSFDAWPPRNVKPKSIYLQPGRRLAFEPAKESSSAFDEYVSDPASPVPYTSAILGNRRSEYMIEDQRFAESRPDVLTYRTAVLDHDITVVGPITADLFVSTSGTDSDFVVKVIDLFPEDEPASGDVQMGGYEMLVRAEIMRAKFRNSYSKPEPMPAGKVTPVKFELRDVCHTFKKGHSLMVQIQSSWFPLVDRNPQKFVDIYKATAGDFQKATERVYHTPKYPSRLEVTVLGE